MTKKISCILSSSLLFAAIAWAIVFNMGKPRIMILHSYSTDYSWTRDIDAGLMRVFERHANYSIVSHYMDAKKHTDENWLRKAKVTAEHAIDRWDPHVLIVVDNVAQEVAQPYVNKNGIDIIFAGINGPIPAAYQTASNVRGIYEYRPCTALRELLFSIRTEGGVPASPDKPNKIRIRYIHDASRSVLSDKPYIDKFDWSPLVYTGSVQANNFHQWKTAVLHSALETDFLFVTNYRQLSFGAFEPPFAKASQVMKWTEENSPVPVIGLNPFNVADGGMLSVGTSPFEQGEVTAKMAEEIIEKKVSRYPKIVTNKQFIVSMRKSALVKRRIMIPAVYEAFSRAVNAYHEGGT